MDVHLDEIIGKIKTEGVDKAKQEADQLLSQAKIEAEKTMQNAKSDAHEIINRANQQSTSILERGKSALQQAERDTVLVVKEKLNKLFSGFIAQQVHGSLDSNVLTELIKKALSQWNMEKNEALFVHVSKDDAQKLVAAGISNLSQGNRKIEIKVDEQISRGFMISQDSGGALKYDFSDQAVSEALSTFLTQYIQELLR